MIAVQAADSEHPVIAEFFELFKTPWQFFERGARAEVVICSEPDIPATQATLVLVYGGQSGTTESSGNAVPGSRPAGTMLLYRGEKIPVYGNSVAFRDSGNSDLKHESSGSPALTTLNTGGRTVVRIGYDLFQEVRHLLTRGQPEANAAIPAMEMHIAILRDLIVGAGIPMIEIPPVPAGHPFIACLTHDVDHVGIKNHKLDHTMFGFLQRASFGSLRDVFRGRKTWAQLATNWLAVLKLPLVHLGLVRDFWYQFDHYVEMENHTASTFFVIPKKGETGLDEHGHRPARRAASYDVADLGPQLLKLRSAGKEIGVHGLDAWRDADAGREEIAIISRLTGNAELGVRMHWLFFDEHSALKLEQAGFSYDSSVGYNGAVGYRAGTTQVFKPLTTANLLELPMHIMDTALFYPSHLNLSFHQAAEMIRPLIAHGTRFGGVLTVNWHDRSIAPERLWDGAYRELLGDLKTGGAWFATAAQTVAWFKKRRGIVFETAGDDAVTIKSAGDPETLPGLRVRVYPPGADNSGFVEKLLPLGGELSLSV